MRRNWIKLYVDQCLRGTMMQEMKDLAERYIWFGFLLLAGDSPFDGKIALTENAGYTNLQLAGLLKCTPELIGRAKKKMVKYGKIKVYPNKIIQICNWHKYQSEYKRQAPYREKLLEKVTNKSDSQKLLLDRDRDKKEIRKEEEIRKENKESSCPKISELEEKKPKKQIKLQLKFSDTDIKLTDLLIDLILKNDPKSSVSRISAKVKADWFNECRKLREIDNRTPEEIEDVIKFSQEDNFEKTNVLSMPKLRKRFSNLYLKSRKDSGSGKKTGSELLREKIEKEKIKDAN